jgi:hypothetical protein
VPDRNADKWIVIEPTCSCPGFARLAEVFMVTSGSRD